MATPVNTLCSFPFNLQDTATHTTRLRWEPGHQARCLPATGRTPLSGSGPRSLSSGRSLPPASSHCISQETFPEAGVSGCHRYQQERPPGVSLTRLKVWVIGEHMTPIGEASHAGRTQMGQLSAGSLWRSVCFPEPGVTCQPSGHSTADTGPSPHHLGRSCGESWSHVHRHGEDAIGEGQ